MVLISQLLKILKPAETQWDGNALLGSTGFSCPSGGFSSRAQDHLCLHIYTVSSNPALSNKAHIMVFINLIPCLTFQLIQNPGREESVCLVDPLEDTNLAKKTD